MDYKSEGTAEDRAEADHDEALLDELNKLDTAMLAARQKLELDMGSIVKQALEKGMQNLIDREKSNQ